MDGALATAGAVVVHRSVGARLFLAASLMGVASSVYWAFSVELVTGSGAGGEDESATLLATTLSAERFGQAFWMLVGITGFGGAAAGGLVRRLGLKGTHALGLAGLAVAIDPPAANASSGAALLSGLLFGASFVLWRLRTAGGSPTAAFGLTFLLVSAGQLAGPFAVGLLIEALGLPALFGLGAVACALLLALPPRA